MPQALSPQQIRKLRESVGMKQREVAHELDYSPLTVKAWERQGKAHRAMSRTAESAFRKLIEARAAAMKDDHDALLSLLPRAA
jgi:DNA-binding transcriptional regulator YiaG